MEYCLVKPTTSRSGVVVKVFRDKSEAIIWFEENKTNPEYSGHYVISEDDLLKVD
jgi:hypothetical protein